MPRIDTPSRLVIDTVAALEECRAAQAEFDRELPAFAALVGITPAMLAKMPIPTLLLLVNMRLFKLLSSKLREIDARTATPTPTPPPPETVQ